MSSLAEQYDTDGFLIVRDVFTPAECQQLKSEAERVMREHKAAQKTVYVGVSVVSPTYQQLAADPRIVDVLKQIMPDGVMFMSDKFVIKTASQRFATPWHIDAFYWPNTRPKLSVWIPLDDATEGNGTLKVVRGSHRMTFRDDDNNGKQSNGEFVKIISQRQWPIQDEITCNVSKGAAIFFSDRLVHGSAASTSGEDRCAIISTYHAPAPDEEFDKSFPARRVLVANGSRTTGGAPA